MLDNVIDKKEENDGNNKNKSEESFKLEPNEEEIEKK